MPRAADWACRWARARLPLLAGDDLLGPDRRRLERHLIGCPTCREHLGNHQQSLARLHQAAELAPTSTQPPSLWPTLARQIREERHPAPRTFGWGLGDRWAWNLPISGLALAASMLVCFGLAGVVYHASTTPEPLGRLVKLVRKPTSAVTMPTPAPSPQPTTLARLDAPSEDDVKPADSPASDTGGTQ